MLSEIDVHFLGWPVTDPQEWSISNFSCSLTRNITSHSMENLAFYTSQMKDDSTTNSHYLTYTLLFRRLRECAFWTSGSLAAWRSPSTRRSAPCATAGFSRFVATGSSSAIRWDSFTYGRNSARLVRTRGINGTTQFVIRKAPPSHCLYLHPHPDGANLPAQSFTLCIFLLLSRTSTGELRIWCCGKPSWFLFILDGHCQ